MKYEVFRTDDKRSVVAISSNYSQEQALTIANEHFKVKKSDLFIQKGRTLGDDQIVFPNKPGDVWVIGRNV